MSKSNREISANSVTKRPWYLKRKLLTAGFSSAVLILSLVVGPKLLKKTEPVVEIPQATASEMPGWWYQDYFGNSVCEKEDCQLDADPDKDKLTNRQEFFYHTDPLDAYTINDELNDGELVAKGFDPSKPGRMTFDEVTSEENLLGESLVFGSDVQNLVAETNNINKVSIPNIKEEDLKINYAEAESVYKNYASKLKSTMHQYFPEHDLNNVKEILKSGNDSDVISIAINARTLSLELKKMEVPVRFLMFHKYNIIMFQLLSEIVQVPKDLRSQESEIWYDKVQAFLAVQQKLSFEEESLKLTSQIK